MNDLYHRDLALWSGQQASALRDAGRVRSNSPVDWEHVAEEIEGLGSAERSALSSLIGTIIEHLLKLTASPARDPRHGWVDSVLHARASVERLLESSPSLRRELPSLLGIEMGRARRLVRRALQQFGETPLTDIDAIAFTEDQVLGDRLPNE